MITATRPNHQITRNSSYFKKIPEDATYQEEADDQEYDLDYTPHHNHTVRPNTPQAPLAPSERR